MQYWGTGRLGNTLNTAYTTASVAIGTAIGPGVQKVRIVATTDTWITIDSSPTATSTGGAYLPGLIPEYFTVSPGQKVAALQVAAPGIIYVTEIL